MDKFLKIQYSIVMTIGQVLENSNIGHLESMVMLSRILKQDKSYLSAHAEQELTPDQLNKWHEMRVQAHAGIPMAYIINEKEFYGLTFFVDQRVLIPRPETETIVDQALAYCDKRNGRSLKILELGCGSGAVIVSLAHTLQTPPHTTDGISLVATDISKGALEIARKNAETFGVNNLIEFKQGDMFEPVFGVKFDLILANLPYLPTEEALLNRHEPHTALVGGFEGDEMNNQLLNSYKDYLTQEGLVIYEGYNGAVTSCNYNGESVTAS
ncbi:peptide chain release factor N(5)-glutamine methyltransferase [candidate division WWE3 bacterium]|nr:peptide chain release factor N(5)-glutamine methyltransferase [candidate division WWE3 bacterium]